MAALGIGSRTVPVPAAHVLAVPGAGDEARVLAFYQPHPILNNY